MNFVPEEFHNFYGSAKPKGKQAILVIDGSYASFYDKRGTELHRLSTTTTNLSGIILEVYYCGK